MSHVYQLSVITPMVLMEILLDVDGFSQVSILLELKQQNNFSSYVFF